MRTLTLVALCALSSPATADEPVSDPVSAPYEAPTFLTKTPELPAALVQGDVMRLSLDEARRIAVKSNFDVQLEQKIVRQTELAVDAANGQFEPVVNARYNHSDTDSPPVTLQEGQGGQIITYVEDAWSLEVVKAWKTGTRTSLGVQSGRTRSSAGTAVEPLNYRSQLQLGVTQPVLRGFSTQGDIQQIEVIRARITTEREREQLMVTLMATVESVEASYWEVVRAMYRYDVAVRSQNQATRQMDLTRRQIDAGTLAPSDLIGAESTLAERELTVLQAEQAIRAASDALRAVLNLPREQWTRPIVPTDVPNFTPTPTTAEAALELALQHRPEVAQLDLELDTAKLAIRAAENNQLPQLDVGLTGTIVGQDRSYTGSVDQVSELEAKGWSVFLNFSWTPLNRTATANTEIAKVQADQTQLRRDQIIQTMWLEVRDAVRDQESAERQIAAAAKFRSLAEQSLAIEERKFLAGQSQNLFVVQRQEAVQSAQLSELEALVAYQRASTTLLRRTGQLLTARNLDVAKR